MPAGGTLLRLSIKQNHPGFRCLQVTAPEGPDSEGKGKKGNKGIIQQWRGAFSRM